MEQAREPEWLRDHPKTREQLAAQEQTEAGDTRARAHRPPEAAPPSAKDRTPIEQRETLRGELLATLGHDCRRVQTELTATPPRPPVGVPPPTSGSW